MNLFIKSAILVDQRHPLNGTKVDILIQDGIITQIAKEIKENKGIEIFEATDLHVSIGWFDLQAYFHDPGLEYKEDLFSGTAAAAAGGYTGVACVSSSHSPLQSKSDIEYILQKTNASAVDVYPIAALSENLSGKEMTEMHDLKQAGAVAFSDGKKGIQDAGLLSRAMLYAKGLKSPLLLFAEDQQLSAGGKMNEGEISTKLGIKGSPALAEEVMVARDLAIADYHQSPIHFSSLSTARSIQLVREAKLRGMAVTCSVSIANLVLTDAALVEFDSNYKVKPALRSQADVDGLWEGLKDGTIDLISSDHCPEDIERKEVEFDHAAYGMIGLQSCFGLIGRVNKHLTINQVIEKISIAPRQLLALPIPEIAENQQANLTLFSPRKEWKFMAKDIKSKSKNSPFFDSVLTGKALAIVNKNQLIAS